MFFENNYTLQDITEDNVILEKFTKKDDGVYKQTIGKNNQLVESLVSSKNDYWEQYANPFAKLSASNFNKSTATQYTINDKDIQSIAFTLTGWNYQVKSMYIELSNNNTQLIIDVDGKLDGSITFRFNISQIEQDIDVKYSPNDKADDLAIAVEDIYKNYVVTDVKHVSGKDDETRVYYRTEDIFFSSFENDEESNYGYAFKKDGIYSFKVENGLARDVTLFNDDSSKEINWRLDFDFSWDLFKYDSTNDIYVTKDTNAASLLADSFAYSYDTYVEFSNYATNIEVKLSGTALDYYVINGSIKGQAFSHKITVSNIGSTSQPFDVSSIDKNKEDLSKITSAYYGTYKGTLEKGSLEGITSDITLVISSDKVTLNDEELTISKIVYYEDKYISATFEWHGVTLEFGEVIHSGDAGKSLQINNESFSIRSSDLIKEVASCAEIKGTYKTQAGLYSFNDKKTYDATLIIEDNNATLSFDSDELSSIEFTFIKLENETYYFKDTNNNSMQVSFYEELLLIEYETLGFYTDSGEFAKESDTPSQPDTPSVVISDYVGLWKSESFYNYNTQLESDWVKMEISEDGTLLLTSSDNSLTGTFTFSRFDSTIAYFVDSDNNELMLELYGELIYAQCNDLGIANDSGKFTKESSTPSQPDTPSVTISDYVGLWKSEPFYNYNTQSDVDWVKMEISEDGTLLLTSSDNSLTGTFTFSRFDSTIAYFVDSDNNELMLELYGELIYAQCNDLGIANDSGDFTKESSTPTTPDEPSKDLANLTGTWKNKETTF